jgi:hypothetical protein
MKTVTINDNLDLVIPSYLENYFPDRWSGTVVDILKHPSMPFEDKLLVVCREDLIDANTLRRFAIWCAKQVEQWFPDDSAKRAIEVAEKFIEGQASREELIAARDESSETRALAWKAVDDVVMRVLRDTVRAVSHDAYTMVVKDEECEEMRSAAWDVIRNAAFEAVMESIKTAARDAAIVAAKKAARDVAWDAVWNAAVKIKEGTTIAAVMLAPREAAIEAAKATVNEWATYAARRAAWEAAIALARDAVWLAAKEWVGKLTWTAAWELMWEPAWKAGWKSARDAQCAKLIEMVEEAA